MNRRQARSASLIAPMTNAPLPSSFDALRSRLARQLATAADGQPQWRELVVTLPILRRALAPRGRAHSWDEPFRWKPVFVRRSLGLAAIEACVRGDFRAPAEAVGPVADEAVVAWKASGWRTYHWEPWLAWLPTGARAVVIAEAVRWATQLWCALEWAELGPELRIGGADDQWACPPNGAVRLRGRVDIRVPLSSGGATAPTECPFGGREAGGRAEGPTQCREALVVTAGGVPPQNWETDLAFPALVSVLHRPRQLAPWRVMGIWPDAGVERTVEIDAELLDRVARRVVAAVARLNRPPDVGYSDGRSGPAAPNSARAAFPSGFPAAVSGISSTTSS